MTPKHSLLVICGPTAAGKSDLAFRIASAVSAEIISADSMQVYRGLDVGTAKPSKEERRQIPHHLIDCADVEETFSAGRFVKEADAAIDEIRARGRAVVICGGTMLYVRALLRGLVATPSDPALRQELENQPTPALQERLGQLDPDSALRWHAHDRVRILRALEITLLAGRPASTLRAAHAFSAVRYPASVLALVPPRALLLQSIDARIDAMMRDGLVEETRFLLERAERHAIPALRAIGYRQVADYLASRCSREQAVAKMRAQTRAFARRQLAWIRSERDVKIVETAEQAYARLLSETRKAS